MSPIPIDAIVTSLSAFPEVRRIILFGSRARGDAAPRSDIDLAIDAPGATRQCWLRLLDAADELPTLLRIDLVLLHGASPALRERIEEEAVVLYERPAPVPRSAEESHA